MPVKTETNGGNKAIKIIGLILSSLAMLGACALAWSTLNSRVACVEIQQETSSLARDKFERRIESEIDMVNRKLDALIFHSGARAPK